VDPTDRHAGESPKVMPAIRLYGRSANVVCVSPRACKNALFDPLVRDAYRFPVGQAYTHWCFWPSPDERNYRDVARIVVATYLTRKIIDQNLIASGEKSGAIDQRREHITDYRRSTLMKSFCHDQTTESQHTPGQSVPVSVL
jgi:hypothetical protein